MIRGGLLLSAALLLGCEQAPAPTVEKDSAGQRIVTLAPHLAELVFAVGAGTQLVGVSAYTDYPEAAKEIAIVSDAFTVDHEALMLLKPDLMLVWESGMPASTIGQLRDRGYPVEVIRTRSLRDIEQAMRTIGQLVGHAATGDAKADAFRDEIAALRQQYSQASRLTAFYQISQDPLYTVNGEHYVSEILTLCGADNIFASLAPLAPNVDVEAVVSRNPELLVASDSAGGDPLAVWRRFSGLAAVAKDNFILLPGDELGRPSDRVLVAARAACDKIAAARSGL